MIRSPEQGLTSSVTEPLHERLLTKTGNAVYNDDVRVFLGKNIANWFSNDEQFGSMVDTESYICEMKTWIRSSQSCTVLGLEDFEVGCVSLGVTQALDQFHYDILQSGRRLRLLRGEYPYHRDVHPFCFETDFIDDAALTPGDAVIISFPFSASGNEPPRLTEILDSCLRLEVPVFLDLAWFGTCGDLVFDLRHPAITHVAFSLTKGLTCGNYRSGVRWTRKKTDLSTTDRLLLQQEWNHSVHLNLKIGRELMKKFGPDTQFHKYRTAQMKVCERFSLEPSPCVHIATSKEDRWREFSRDGVIQRINLRDAIKLLNRVQAE